MIRVVYRWTVDPERAETFVAAWWEATRCIQQGCQGACGSVLLKSQREPNVYVAVARWDSLAAWQASRQPEVSVVPKEIADVMMASRTGPGDYEIFEELRDWPSPGAAQPAPAV